MEADLPGVERRDPLQENDSLSEPSSSPGIRLRPYPCLCHLPGFAAGQLLVLVSCLPRTWGSGSSPATWLRPHLAMNYGTWLSRQCGDPAGMARKDTDEKTCFMELAEEGIAVRSGFYQFFVGRSEAVAKYLTRMVDGSRR
jgi:hypothetical protein